jgi:UDP-N-acetylglucosamine--N-acetylmuramyl-(pentapeptide) pyrophosphoryl-undecaprenol N-acetylglucosamine transferase
MQIRRFIHEQNAIPGMTNKVLSRVVGEVFISLDEAQKFFPKGKSLLTGNPIRREILAAAAQSQNPPLHPFDKEGRPSRRGDFRLLVFGGSAGAHSINQALMEALPHLRDHRERLLVTHQTGENDLEEVRQAYDGAGFRAEVIPFINDMASAYSGASLVICRAGATTIAEMTACGRAAIFIPYPHAVDDHQRRNAEALLKQGAGFMLLERELSGENLAKMIIELVGSPEMIVRTEESARGLARLNAAQVIVDEMLKP